MRRESSEIGVHHGRLWVVLCADGRDESTGHAQHEIIEIEWLVDDEGKAMTLQLLGAPMPPRHDATGRWPACASNACRPSDAVSGSG